MISDGGQYLTQVRLRVQVVQFGRTDQAVNGGGAIAAGIGTGEETVLAAGRHRTQRAAGRSSGSQADAGGDWLSAIETGEVQQHLGY